jgi:hypothetical protein
MASAASASNPVIAAESPASGGSSSCSWLSPASLPHAHTDRSLQQLSFPNLNRTSFLPHYHVFIRGGGGNNTLSQIFKDRRQKQGKKKKKKKKKDTLRKRQMKPCRETQTREQRELQERQEYSDSRIATRF